MSRKQQHGKKRAAREAARKKAKRRQQIRTGLIGLGVVAVIALAIVVIRPASSLTGVTTQTGWDLPGLHDTESRITLDQFAGKPTVAAFYASWCPHCQRELPGFAALSREIDDDVNFVGINSQDSGGGKGLAASSGIDAWPLARDVGGRDGRNLSVTAFGARGMPLTVIYGPNGEVADITQGPMTAGQLLTKLETLFGI